MEQNYLFIDGGFLRAFIKSQKQKDENAPTIDSIYWTKLGMRYDRILYYDAFPEKGPNQNESDFQKELAEAEALFTRIASTPKFSVRPALTRRGQKREQKGVDILLSIECLLHAIRNNVDEVTIATSDLDFFPLFEALLQTKTKSKLLYQVGRTSNELIYSADFHDGITAWDVLYWTSEGNNYYNPAQLNYNDLDDAEIVHESVFMGEQIQVVKIQDHMYSPIFQRNRASHGLPTCFAAIGYAEHKIYQNSKLLSAKPFTVRDGRRAV